MAATGSAQLLDGLDPYQRGSEIFPELTDEQIARASDFGSVEQLHQGAMLFRDGDRSVDFFIVISGSIEIYEDTDTGPSVVTTHHANNFTGELDLFNDRMILVSGRMGEDGKVLRVPRASFRKLLLAEPDIGDVVMRAFIMRRLGFITHEQASVTLIHTEDCPDGLRIERFLRRNGYPVRSLNLNDEDARSLLETAHLRTDDCPALLRANRKPLVNPSNKELADSLGLLESIDDCVYDVAIVGAGPAGLAAAVYAASEGLGTIVLETEAPGGQAGTSSKIENYLGFPTGLTGLSLAGRAQVQAQKFGARIALARQVMKLSGEAGNFEALLDDGTAVRARTIVVASGARYRGLDLRECRLFEGLGVHYAATPLEARLCANEDVVVVGGGNSAGQAAVFLSKTSKHIYMLVRGKRLADSMSDYLVGRIQASQRISLLTETEVVSLEGDRRLERITWRNAETGETTAVEARHLFLMIGAEPNTDWLGTCVALDSKGFVCVGTYAKAAGWPLDREPYILETSRPGVFAVGDVRAESVKRVASAVGEGSIAVQFIHRVLSEIASVP